MTVGAGVTAGARTRVAAAVLAAGAGTRFVDAGADRNTPKLLATVGGLSLLTRALDAPVAARCIPVLAVVADRTSRVSLHAADHHGVTVVENSRSAAGMSTSMQAAVAALRDLDTSDMIGACCFALGDQPLIGAESYRRLSEAFTSGAQLAVATYGARRGHPVLIARSLWNDLGDLTGDRGARELLESGAVAEVACDDTGDPVDVDTIHELRALEAR